MNCELGPKPKSLACRVNTMTTRPLGSIPSQPRPLAHALDYQELIIVSSVSLPQGFTWTISQHVSRAVALLGVYSDKYIGIFFSLDTCTINYLNELRQPGSSCDSEPRSLTCQMSQDSRLVAFGESGCSYLSRV